MRFAQKAVTIRMAGRVDDDGVAVLGYEFDGIVPEPKSEGTETAYLSRPPDGAQFVPGDVGSPARNAAARVKAELIGNDLGRPVEQFKAHRNCDYRGFESVFRDGLAAMGGHEDAEGVHNQSAHDEDLDPEISWKSNSLRVKPVAE